MVAAVAQMGHPHTTSGRPWPLVARDAGPYYFKYSRSLEEEAVADDRA